MKTEDRTITRDNCLQIEQNKINKNNFWFVLSIAAVFISMLTYDCLSNEHLTDIDDGKVAEVFGP